MDRKEKKGNPWEGPMKRIEPPASLPAPPDISTVIEEPKEEPKQEARNCPKEYLDLRCPCGLRYEDCEGFLGGFMSRDETFAAIARGRGE